MTLTSGVRVVEKGVVR